MGDLLATSVNRTTGSTPARGIKQASNDQTTTFRRLVMRYFQHLLPQIHEDFRILTPQGLIDVNPDSFFPPTRLPAGIELQVYPAFTLLDFDKEAKALQATTLPFKLNGQLFAVRLTYPGQAKRPWAQQAVCSFPTTASGRYEIIDGQSYLQERAKRMVAAYQDYGQFVNRQDNRVNWLVSKIGKRDGEILSIGCADACVEVASNRIHGNRFLGIDISSQLATQAQIQTIIGDANNLMALLQQSGKRTCFQTIMLFESIGYFFLDEFLPQIRQMLGNELLVNTPLDNNEVRRFVDQQDGCIASPHYQYYDWPTTQARIEAFGFKIQSAAFIREEFRLSKKGNFTTLFKGTTDDPAQASMVFFTARTA